MCGRYAITLPPEAMRAFFRYLEQPNFPARFNVAPTQPVPIVRAERGPDGRVTRHFVLVRWGFLPGFVKDPKDFPLVINARAETVPEKASFRNALRRRRCIFVADAFYEWRRAPGPRRKGAPPPQPYLIRRRDGQPMALAGLWEHWVGPNGEEVETACIVTTHANGLISALHDRMPVILEPEDFDTWLDCTDEAADAAARLMRPAGEDVLEFFPIDAALNKATADGPELQEPKGPVERADGGQPQAPRSAPAAAAVKLQGDLFG